MESVSAQMVAAAKLPVLNPGEFELWKMRIEQYFLMTDYALWEVIVNEFVLKDVMVVAIPMINDTSDDEASNHEDASDTGAAPKQQQQVIPQTYFAYLKIFKLPIYEEESMIYGYGFGKHYLEYIDNDVWKVIQNGNSKKRISTGKDGVIRILPPVTTAEIQAVEKERKAKNILLMAYSPGTMRDFMEWMMQKEIWEAIRTRFGVMQSSKKMQKDIFKQQFGSIYQYQFRRGEHTEDEETNHALMAISSSMPRIIGTSSVHSVDLESEISRVPQEVYVFKPITTNVKGTTGSEESREIEAYKCILAKVGAASRRSLTSRFSPNPGERIRVNTILISQSDRDSIQTQLKDDERDVYFYIAMIIHENVVDRCIFDSGMLRAHDRKSETRKSSTNSKKEEILTEPQQEKEASSTGTSEDNPKILAFRRELEAIAQKHLGTVPENNSTSTPSVNSGSEPVNMAELSLD
ncbi:hypothetical protein Tco_1108528 [Tanacetum coccineum]